MNVVAENDLQFLAGGGEMGELTRAKDWSETLVGNPRSWPQSLRTTLGIILNSKFPMFLWWGPELICFYNDAYRPSLGKDGKHPYILGMKAADAWPEIWDIIKPLIDQVLEGEGSVWFKDKLVPIYRNGKIEDVYWTFSYSPVNDESDKVAGVLVTCTETTEKVNTLRKMEESEERFRMMADNIPNLAWMAKADGWIYWYNKQWYQYTGTTPEEMEGWGWQSVHDVAELPHVLKKWQASIANGEEFEMVFPLKGADGKFRSFLTRVLPVRNNEGEIIQWFGSNTDISKQKETEEALQESKDQLEFAIEATELGTWEYNPLTNKFTSNQRLKEWFGLAGGEQIGLSHAIDAMLESDRQRVTNAIQKALDYSSGGNYNIEYTIVHPVTKKQTIVCAKGKAFFNDKKIAYRFNGTLEDITEQAILNNKVKESEKRFRLLADAMPQHIWTSGPDGNLNYFNRSVFDYSGLTHEQLNKDGWIQIVHPDDREENIKQWSHAIATGKDFLMEHRFRRHDGVYRWQLSRAVPQKDESGRIQLWVGTSTDIQEIKELDQQKDSFLSMASHELKTPVTTIKAYGQIAEAMLAKKGDTETLGMINKMGTQVNKLTNLIGDLLDITKIQKGKLRYNEAFFDFNETVKEVVDDMQRTSATHRIQNNAAGEVKIYGDKEKISQVLNNLISNAIKYSPQADKIIVVTRLKENGIEVSVKDFGIGIPAKEQPHVFEQFYRVTGNNQSTFPGMGIGLFICSEITKMHGGKIWTESVIGQGSTFHIWLPVDHREIVSS